MKKLSFLLTFIFLSSLEATVTCLEGEEHYKDCWGEVICVRDGRPGDDLERYRECVDIKPVCYVSIEKECPPHIHGELDSNPKGKTPLEKALGELH